MPRKSLRFKLEQLLLLSNDADVAGRAATAPTWASSSHGNDCDDFNDDNDDDYGGNDDEFFHQSEKKLLISFVLMVIVSTGNKFSEAAGHTHVQLSQFDEPDTEVSPACCCVRLSSLVAPPLFIPHILIRVPLVAWPPDQKNTLHENKNDSFVYAPLCFAHILSVGGYGLLGGASCRRTPNSPPKP